MSQSEQPEGVLRRREAERPLTEDEADFIDRIRDILFGSQMRDYEQRFSRLEEALVKESADLRETTRRRFDQLEQYLMKELKELKSEAQSRRQP